MPNCENKVSLIVFRGNINICVLTKFDHFEEGPKNIFFKIVQEARKVASQILNSRVFNRFSWFKKHFQGEIVFFLVPKFGFVSTPVWRIFEIITIGKNIFFGHYVYLKMPTQNGQIWSKHKCWYFPRKTIYEPLFSEFGIILSCMGQYLGLFKN